MPKSRPASSSEPTLLHQGPTSLAQWLEISWFYPQGFVKDVTIETSRAWISLGNGIAYKFFKLDQATPGTEKEESFEQRWRLACEEINDHRDLAPNFYLGLRLLRWIDDEPQWMSEKTTRSLAPGRAPRSAQDVALVMRRIPQEQFLTESLRTGRRLPSNSIPKLARILRDFHNSSTRKSLVTFRDDPTLLHSILSERYLRPLNTFILSHGSFLDPFSQIAFEELRGFIGSYLERKALRFTERLRDGAFVDCHGELRAKRVIIDEEGNISIIGRMPRNSPERFADYLSDIASLVVDLELNGHSQAASLFESSYFPTALTDEGLYRFYKVAEATRRAQTYFQEDTEEEGNFGPAALSYALKTSLGLDRPFLVVISSLDKLQGRKLGKSLEVLLEGQLLSGEIAKSALIGRFFPARPALDRTLQKVEQGIVTGKSFIIDWPLNREEERVLLQRFAIERNIPLLFVSLETARSVETSSLTERRILSLRADREQSLAELNTRHVSVDATLPAPELALLLLRELSSTLPRID